MNTTITPQIDMMILTEVSDSNFTLTIPCQNKDYIYKLYTERGFHVSINNETIQIDWSRPDLDLTKNTPKNIYSNFTAQDLYMITTQGTDLRFLTNTAIYQRLIRENSITETYGVDPKAVYNLYNDAIETAKLNGFSIAINEYGVITSKKEDLNISDINKGVEK